MLYHNICIFFRPAKQRAKTADYRHTIRFIIVLEHCPQKNRPDTRTKTAQKRRKNV